MKKISRKELRQNTADTLNTLINQLELDSTSKKARKIVAKVSKKFSKELKQEIRKQLKKNQKATARKSKTEKVKEPKAMAA